MTTYIHYGCREFNKELFQPIRNREYFTKPYGGLWASDVNAQYGWRQWNEEEGFVSCEVENSFCFTLKKNAKVIHLYNVDDFQDLPLLESMPSSWFLIDFEKLVEIGVDAVELHLSEGNHALYFPLYGWDCDSILVMNPDVVEVV